MSWGSVFARNQPVAIRIARREQPKDGAQNALAEHHDHVLHIVTPLIRHLERALSQLGRSGRVVLDIRLGEP